MPYYLPGGKALLSGGKFVTAADACCCHQCSNCDDWPSSVSVTLASGSDPHGFSGVHTCTKQLDCTYLHQFISPLTGADCRVIVECLNSPQGWEVRVRKASPGFNCIGHYVAGPNAGGPKTGAYTFDSFDDGGGCSSGDYDAFTVSVA